MSNFHLKPFVAVLLIAFLTACASGQKTSDPVATTAVPKTGDAAIGLSVTAARPYVVNGDKPDSVVGVYRREGGSQFDSYTRGKVPFANDVEKAILNSSAAWGLPLKRLNVPATDSNAVSLAAGNDGLSRVVTIEVLEWKSISYQNGGSVKYDLVLRVFDAQGVELAAANNKGADRLKSWSLASESMNFQRAISDMFGQAQIADALDI